MCVLAGQGEGVAEHQSGAIHTRLCCCRTGWAPTEATGCASAGQGSPRRARRAAWGSARLHLLGLDELSTTCLLAIATLIAGSEEGGCAHRL